MKWVKRKLLDKWLSREEILERAKTLAVKEQEYELAKDIRDLQYRIEKDPDKRIDELSFSGYWVFTEI